MLKDPDLSQFFFIQWLWLFWGVFWAAYWANVEGLLI